MKMRVGTKAMGKVDLATSHARSGDEEEQRQRESEVKQKRNQKELHE